MSQNERCIRSAYSKSLSFARSALVLFSVLFLIPGTETKAESSLLAINAKKLKSIPLKKEILKIGVLGRISSLHPLFRNTPAGDYIYSLTSHPLTSLDENWNWQCMLCSEMPSVENEKIKKIRITKRHKKLEVTWRIGEKVSWGDGTPVTGYDAFFTWKIGKSAFTRTSNPRQFTAIESIEVDQAEPKLFTTRFRKSNYQNTKMGGFRLVPRHLERSLWKNVQLGKKTYSESTTYQKDMTNPGLYNGPFLVSKFEPKKITLTRNPYFYGPKSSFKKIIVYIEPNVSQLTKKLESGAIDMLAESGQLMQHVQELDNWMLTKPTPLLVSKKAGESIIFEHILFNLRNPILTDRNVRKALILALDRPSLIKNVLNGKADLADSNIHPKDPIYTKREETFSYDPAEAARLLKSSGWLGPNDEYRQKDGDLLSLDIVTAKGNKLRMKMIARFTEAWKKIGIRITVRVENSQKFFDDTLRKSRFTGMAFLASEQKADTLPIAMLDSREIPSNRNKHKGQNSGAWVNKKVDRNFDRLKKETDFSKRKKIMAKILVEFDKDLPMIPLLYSRRIAIIPANLEGFNISGHQFPSALGSPNWHYQ